MSQGHRVKTKQRGRQQSALERKFGIHGAGYLMRLRAGGPSGLLVEVLNELEQEAADGLRVRRGATVLRPRAPRESSARSA